MAIVRVEKKGQVTLPVRLRRQARVNDGDLLEAQWERGKITLTPKFLLDRQIRESLEDYKKGRFYGPFGSAEEMVASLKAHLKKRSKRMRRAG